MGGWLSVGWVCEWVLGGCMSGRVWWMGDSVCFGPTRDTITIMPNVGAGLGWVGVASRSGSKTGGWLWF